MDYPAPLPVTHLATAPKPCRVHAVAMVRNDADIILPFLRQCAALFDTTYIIDIQSTDGTRECIAEFDAGRGRIVCLSTNRQEKFQGPMMNTLSRHAFANGADWVFLLDADEFIDISSRVALELYLADFNADAMHLSWVNLVPSTYGGFSTFEPDQEFPWSGRASTYFKVALSNRSQPITPTTTSTRAATTSPRRVRRQSPVFRPAIAARADPIGASLQIQDQRRATGHQGQAQSGRGRGQSRRGTRPIARQQHDQGRAEPFRRSLRRQNRAQAGTGARRAGLAHQTIAALRQRRLRRTPSTDLRRTCRRRYCATRRSPGTNPLSLLEARWPPCLSTTLSESCLKPCAATARSVTAASPARRETGRPAQRDGDADRCRRNRLHADQALCVFSLVRTHPGPVRLLSVSRPRRFVELGVHNGMSFFAACQAVEHLKIDAECVAIDSWVGDEHAGFHSDEVFTNFKAYAAANHPNQFYVQSYFDAALQCFEDGSIDLLHIDGLHTYDAVRAISRRLPKMSNAGVIMFHDTNVLEREFGVWRLWDELRQRYPGFNFLHKHGLGIIYVGSASSPVASALRDLATNSERAVLAQTFFEAAGTLVIEHRSRLEDCDRLRNDTEILHRQIHQIHADHAVRTHEVAAQLAANQRDIELLRTWLADAQNLASLEAERLRAIYSSSAWRITGPFRRMLSRAPLLRRFVRGTARVAKSIVRPSRNRSL